MTTYNEDKKKEKFDKRAANLRANLKRRKSQTRKPKEKAKAPPNPSSTTEQD